MVRSAARAGAGRRPVCGPDAEIATARRAAGRPRTAMAAGLCLAVAIAAVIVLAAAPASTQGYLRLTGHGGPINAVAVAPQGRLALTASFDYSVGLWSLDEARLIRWFEGHEAAVNAVAFHPDGRHLLSAGDDFDLILWDRASGAPLHRFEGHRAKILAIAISPGGRLAATAGWDGDIRLWDLEARAPAGRLSGHRANVNDLAFSRDGATLWSVGYDGSLREWDVATRRERAVLVSHGFGLNRLVIDEDAGWIAYGALDGTVRVRDLATGRRLADLTADRRPILAMALDPARRLLAIGDGEGHIMVVDTADWSVARDFRAARQGPIWALAWDGAGRVLAGGLADSAAAWPVGGGEALLFAEGRRHFQTPPGEMPNGQRQFVRKCAICHSLTPDGQRRAGPSLHGVFGRPAGAVPGYAYSPALDRSDIVWSAETIDRLFAEGPDRVTPGSKMPMQRIARAEDRADLIAYLRSETAPDKGSDTE